MNLFAYGTLMIPEIWERVVGREFRRQEASVRGMAVYRAAGELFPVMVASGDEVIAAGIVYFDLPADVVAMLDEYESDFYERVDVTATLDDGGSVSAETYLLPSGRRSFATDEPWNLAWFRNEALERYLERYGL